MDMMDIESSLKVQKVGDSIHTQTMKIRFLKANKSLPNIDKQDIIDESLLYNHQARILNV